jgi:predicted transcriptional regulator
MGVNMKTIKMKQLEKKEEEIVDGLISLGMSRNVAMMLV